MSSYEFAYTYSEKNLDENSFAKQEFFFVRPLVVGSTIFSAACRSIFENPIEYAKVMGQTGKKWDLKDIYRGTTYQVIRTTGLLIPIFASLDVFRRKTTIMQTFYGNFFVTAGKIFYINFLG